MQFLYLYFLYFYDYIVILYRISIENINYNIRIWFKKIKQRINVQKINSISKSQCGVLDKIVTQRERNLGSIDE